MKGHWERFQALWDEILPPLRPPPSAVRAFREAASPRGRRVLVLGVTPELAVLGRRTTAVDHAREMIENVWPGSRDGRRVLEADWRSMPLDRRSVDVAYGDGAINVLAFPEEVVPVLTEVDRVLAPGGRAVFRVYCRPEPPETLDDLARSVHAGNAANVFSLKWRLAMARVAEADDGPSVEVPELLEAFDATFPDRRALAADTGISPGMIDTVDLWEGSQKTFSFPTLRESLDLLEPRFGEVGVTGSGDYPLSERCPLLVCRKGRR